MRVRYLILVGLTVIFLTGFASCSPRFTPEEELVNTLVIAAHKADVTTVGHIVPKLATLPPNSQQEFMSFLSSLQNYTLKTVSRQAGQSVIELSYPGPGSTTLGLSFVVGGAESDLHISPDIKIKNYLGTVNASN